MPSHKEMSKVLLLRGRSPLLLGHGTNCTNQPRKLRKTLHANKSVDFRHHWHCLWTKRCATEDATRFPQRLHPASLNTSQILASCRIVQKTQSTSTGRSSHRPQALSNHCSSKSKCQASSERSSRCQACSIQCRRRACSRHSNHDIMH